MLLHENLNLAMFVRGSVRGRCQLAATQPVRVAVVEAYVIVADTASSAIVGFAMRALAVHESPTWK